MQIPTFPYLRGDKMAVLAPRPPLLDTGSHGRRWARPGLL